MTLFPTKKVLSYIKKYKVLLSMSDWKIGFENVFQELPGLIVAETGIDRVNKKLLITFDKNSVINNDLEEVVLHELLHAKLRIMMIDYKNAKTIGKGKYNVEEVFVNELVEAIMKK